MMPTRPAPALRPARRRRHAAAPVLAALLVTAACGGGGERDPLGRDATGPVAPVTVRLARVEVGRALRTVRAMGSFSALDEVVVAAKVAGRVVEVGPEVGDRAAKDALLTRVDPTDYVLLREQKARMLAESLARLGLEQLPDGEVAFDALPSIERSRLESDNAKARYERAIAVRERTPGAYSDQDLGDLKMAWDVAESALRGVRLTARADLAQARTRKADLALAEQLARDTEVRVPDGAEVRLVADRRVAVGDYVAVGAPLYRLLASDPLRLRVRVPERRMPGVLKGCEVAVTTAGQAAPLPARVLRIHPEVDLRTRTFEVEIEVPNPGLALAVGAFAVAEIRVGEDTAVRLVAASAIRTFAGETKVVVVAEGKAAERRVVLGRRLGDRVEIVEGLAAGDLHVVAPPPTLVSGTPVSVEEAAPAAETR